MLDKKQIQAIFIPKFKTGDKVVETTCNINNAFGPESANKCTVLQEVLQKRWEPWRWGAQWLVFGSCQWPIERIIKADLQVYMRSCQELNVDHFKIIQHLKQIRKVKKLSKWVPHEQTKSFKKPSFWSVTFSYYTQQQTILQLHCDVQQKVDFIWQLVKTSSVVGPRRSFKSLTKAKLAPKKCPSHW